MRYKFLRFPEGKEKALTLSYDDGCRYDVRLIEIANRYGLKVTLNVSSNMMGNSLEDWCLPAWKIKELAESGGHEIAVHGANHVALGTASTEQGIYDVLTGRDTLEKEFGRIIRGLAYADTGITKLTAGVSLKEIKQYLKSLGIAYARTLNGDNDRFAIPEDFYEWMPTARHANPRLMEYLDKFLEAKLSDYCAVRSPMLFYLWGHSFEFEQNGNWDLFERFCEKAGNNENVWYATNIEICDYVAAYRSLQFSIDNSRVFNPTYQTVWFEADGRIISVLPGEMKEI